MAVLGEQDEARKGGREHFEQRRWEDAYRALASARDALDPEERLLLAMSAYLLGREDDCVAHLEDAYHDLDAAGEPAWAARCAFWLCFVLLNRGDMARGGGWVARGQQLVERHDLDCVERGYLMVPAALQPLYSGNGSAAEEQFREIFGIASRFEDPDLLTLSRLGRGQALVVQGQVQEALPLLDEAMVAVIANEVSPVVAGLVYCAVIEACQDTFDLRRAQEWTEALSDWCDAQPDLVPYRGQCQVHRVEILRIHGEWRDAMTEVGLARQRLSRPPGQAAVGAAVYQEAELHRLRGQFQRADECYAEASAHGHDPQPGLARLRLAQGAVDAAVAGLRRALEEGQGRSSRPRLLSAYVEALLSAGDVTGAAEAADELSTIADQHDVPLLRAIASQAIAAVRLDQNDAADALREARRAWTIWNEFGAPYEAARARVLVGRACRELEDHDAARLEFEAARRALTHLGARYDLALLDTAAQRRAAPAAGGLTPREVEVLRLVAQGRTNRSVADELVVSEKTVARHLSNIYTKLGVSSRAAATAWAFTHELG